MKITNRIEKNMQSSFLSSITWKGNIDQLKSVGPNGVISRTNESFEAAYLQAQSENLHAIVRVSQVTTDIDESAIKHTDHIGGADTMYRYNLHTLYSIA